MTSRTDDATTGDFERIACHEAGHVAGWRHFDHSRALFLERGRVLVSAAGGYGLTNLGSGNSWSPSLMPSLSPPIDHASIVTAMAGRAAEALRYPCLNRAELVMLSAASDEPLARRYIQVLCSNLSDAEVADRINAAETEALQIVRGAWGGVKALAEKLLACLKTGLGDEVELTGAEALRVMDAALDGSHPVEGA